jgi:hypothetical protein
MLFIYFLTDPGVEGRDCLSTTIGQQRNRAGSVGCGRCKGTFLYCPQKELWRLFGILPFPSMNDSPRGLQLWRRHEYLDGGGYNRDTVVDTRPARAAIPETLFAGDIQDKCIVLA